MSDYEPAGLEAREAADGLAYEEWRDRMRERECPYCGADLIGNDPHNPDCPMGKDDERSDDDDDDA